MVIRHPRDGAARLAADYSPIPVINGGDGSHEHPTQTLCDLFTLKKKNKHLKNLKVAISGDLRGSRTIHSFVYALARFGATIMPMPAKGMELPEHVGRRLREEFGCQMVSVQKGEGDPSIDALYVTPKEPHQQSLFAGPEIDDIDVVEQKVDAVYVTRFQKERWVEKDQPYPKIDRKFLNEPKYSEASVLHPLPRVGELDASVDADRRAVYFEQAAYGVPVRMALISLLLGIKGKSLHKFEGGFERKKFPVYDQPRSVGMHCINSNCIVHDPMEAQYVRNKFYIIPNGAAGACKLRCVYCESDVEHFVVASKKNKWFTNDAAPLLRTNDQQFKELVVFANDADAIASGFHSRRTAVEPRSSPQEGVRARAKTQRGQ
jgi:aspartate carbamoyltransferase catalytic subunit